MPPDEQPDQQRAAVMYRLKWWRWLRLRLIQLGDRIDQAFGGKHGLVVENTERRQSIRFAD